MDDPRDIFPERLEALLQARGYTDRDAGDAVGVDVVQVGAWLSGHQFPCPRQFERLRVFLGVERDELLT